MIGLVNTEPTSQVWGRRSAQSVRRFSAWRRQKRRAGDDQEAVEYVLAEVDDLCHALEVDFVGAVARSVAILVRSGANVEDGNADG